MHTSGALTFKHVFTASSLKLMLSLSFSQFRIEMREH